LLFDIDGVLVDTSSLMLDAYHKAIVSVTGRRKVDIDLRAVLDLSPRTVLRAFDASQVDRMHTVYERYFRSHYQHDVTPVSGLREVIEQLASELEIVLGVVTSRNKQTARQALRVSGVANYIAALITWGDTGRHKPDPDPILLALTRLMIDADRAAYVGDRVQDVQAGRRAGVLTIAALWCGTTVVEELKAAGADHIVAEPQELLDIVIGM